MAGFAQSSEVIYESQDARNDGKTYVGARPVFMIRNISLSIKESVLQLGELGPKQPEHDLLDESSPSSTQEVTQTRNDKDVGQDIGS